MNEEQTIMDDIHNILESDERNKLELFICKIKWQLTASVYRYFSLIDKLYKDKKISKERHNWLVKERPFKLIKELVDSHEITFNYDE